MSETKTTRDDGPYENVFLGVGTAKDRSVYTKHVTPRILDNVELDCVYECDGFARRIIDLPAEEMVRAGFEIEGIDDGREVIAELEGINTLPSLCDALRWDALHGGAVIVMLANDGGTLDDPLNDESVKAIEQLRVYDRWQISHHEKYDDPADMTMVLVLVT